MVVFELVRKGLMLGFSANAYHMSAGELTIKVSEKRTFTLKRQLFTYLCDFPEQNRSQLPEVIDDKRGCLAQYHNISHQPTDPRRVVSIFRSVQKRRAYFANRGYHDFMHSSGSILVPQT